ncbi:hypothetical protein DSL72_000915 [Monilinia vaccinii-corymbosi]|uniref:Uncharacterized protein n=1 Tax=Monilinia vaccinii-corymbosi TaxID=61207 RepID=A0A8A3P2T8_9HELO|nr:hypothetical protein DSL72_000915 [Monilinia vaccinii-corymbosi]
MCKGQNMGHLPRDAATDLQANTSAGPPADPSAAQEVAIRATAPKGVMVSDSISADDARDASLPTRSISGRREILRTVADATTRPTSTPTLAIRTPHALTSRKPDETRILELFDMMAVKDNTVKKSNGSLSEYEPSILDRISSFLGYDDQANLREAITGEKDVDEDADLDGDLPPSKREKARLEEEDGEEDREYEGDDEEEASRSNSGVGSVENDAASDRGGNSYRSRRSDSGYGSNDMTQNVYESLSPSPSSGQEQTAKLEGKLQEGKLQDKDSQSEETETAYLASDEMNSEFSKIEVDSDIQDLEKIDESLLDDFWGLNVDKSRDGSSKGSEGWENPLSDDSLEILGTDNARYLQAKIISIEKEPEPEQRRKRRYRTSSDFFGGGILRSGIGSSLYLDNRGIETQKGKGGKIQNGKMRRVERGGVERELLGQTQWRDVDLDLEDDEVGEKGEKAQKVKKTYAETAELGVVVQGEVKMFRET